MQTARLICASLFATALAACYTAPTKAYAQPREPAALPERPIAETPPKVEPAPAIAAVPETCPVHVQGTTVSFEETTQGGALVFTTIGDADQLRTELYGIADTHNEMHAKMGPMPVEGSDNVARAAESGAGASGTAAPDTRKATTKPATSEPDLGNATSKDKSYGGVASDGTKGTSKDVPSANDGIYASGGVTTKRPVAELGPDAIATHSRARVESIAGGARIVFVGFPDEVQALRNELREHASRLRQECAWGEAPANQPPR